MSTMSVLQAKWLRSTSEMRARGTTKKVLRRDELRRLAEGFTLVELLIVVVILGVLSAVGVPAYFAQLDRARTNSANAAAMGAAKACAAAATTGDQSSFAAGEGVTGTCNASGTASSFTSSVSGITTQAVGTVAADGSVSLSTKAAK